MSEAIALLPLLCKQLVQIDCVEPGILRLQSTFTVLEPPDACIL